MSLEIVIGGETRMVNAKVLRLFSNETFENRPRKIIQKSEFHPDNHLEMVIEMEIRFFTSKI